MFVLIMTAHPEVQKKAHAELDAVVGLDRTPKLADIEHLPYVQAIIKEVDKVFAMIFIGDANILRTGSSLPTHCATWLATPC
jgi:hypothetical protein